MHLKSGCVCSSAEARVGGLEVGVDMHWYFLKISQIILMCGHASESFPWIIFFFSFFFNYSCSGYILQSPHNLPHFLICNHVCLPVFIRILISSVSRVHIWVKPGFLGPGLCAYVSVCA